MLYPEEDLVAQKLREEERERHFLTSETRGYQRTPPPKLKLSKSGGKKPFLAPLFGGPSPPFVGSAKFAPFFPLSPLQLTDIFQKCGSLERYNVISEMEGEGEEEKGEKFVSERKFRMRQLLIRKESARRIHPSFPFLSIHFTSTEFSLESTQMKAQLINFQQKHSKGCGGREEDAISHPHPLAAFICSPK